MNDFSQRLNELSPEKRALLLRRMQEKVQPGSRAITRRPNQEEHPLSFAQQRMWFLEQLQPDVSLYNITTPLEIRTTQDTEWLRSALVECLSEIVRRHEVLRATFVFKGGTLVQQIQPPAALALPYADLSALPEAQRADEASRIMREEVQRRFDLSRDMLLRMRLLRLEPERYLLVLTVHHSAFDAWSVGVLIEEMAPIFVAIGAGLPVTRPPMELQYADFAAWQRDWLQGEVLEQQLSYWKGQLKGPLPVLDLPTDRPRPAVRTANGAHLSFGVPALVSGQLRALSRRHEVTLFMTLLAAWSVLLSRYSGQDDLLIGTPIANRNRKELEQLIGFFVNTLVLRVDVASHPSFVDLLAQVRKTALDAYAHQDLPFEILVDTLQVERDLSRTPLFQVLFALQNTPTRNAPAGFSILTEIDSPAKFDLALTMSDDGQDLRGVLEYNTDLFDESTIARMIGHLLALLEDIAQHPERAVSALEILPPAERERMLVSWNMRERSYPSQVCVHQLFEARVAEHARRPALVYGATTLDYQSLNERANQVAHLLRRRGAGPGTLVGILVERSPEMIVALLGVLKSGAAYVPLDPAYPIERLVLMIEDANSPILLVQEHLLELAQRSASQGGCQVICLDRPGELAQEPLDDPRCVAGADDLAYVIYTSGSTGRPKGVQLRHRGLCNLVQEQIEGFGLTPDSRVLQMASFSFDASVSEIFTTLIAGATLYLLPPETERVSADIVELLRRYQISVVTLPPSLLAVLPSADLPQLETLICAGEHCPAEVVRRWGAGRRFLNAYGPTEATVCATMMVCDPASELDPPIGRPIGNVEIYLLDQQLQPVPIGVPGEIFIGGVGVADGYLNQPALSAAKFLPNPFKQGRIYRTGDGGRYRPDGTLVYHGRLDGQVKIRGFRVELGEVEHVLAQQPGVAAAVVVAQQDPVVGLRLVGFISASQPDLSPEEETGLIAQVSAGLRDRLPAYMYPAAIMLLATFPLTPNGKIDRRALAQRAITRRGRQGEDDRGPEGELEQTIAAVWAQVLQLPLVGVHDNFFDLGGNSLSMMRVLSQLQETIAPELTIRALFKYPTISSLAQHLRFGEAEGETTLRDMPDLGQRQREALQRQKRRFKR